MLSILIVFSVLFPVLFVGFANADFLEDVSSTPRESALDDILDYCESNPNGNITVLVDNEEISEFYTGYTCDQAAQEKAWIDNDFDPDANVTDDEELPKD
jgi:hypothetical protein